LPTALGGAPFDVFPRIVIIIVGLQADFLLNSVYKYFKKKNRLVLWSIFSGLEFFLLLPFFQILFFPLFFNSQFVANFTNIVLIMLPWIIGGAIIGGYLGYKVYDNKLKKI
jgi:hypothetical protein